MPDDFPQKVIEPIANIYIAGEVDNSDLTIQDGLYVALANSAGFPLEIQISSDGAVNAVTCDKPESGFDHHDKEGFRCLKDNPSYKVLPNSSSKKVKLIESTSYDFLVCIRSRNLEVLSNGKRIFSGRVPGIKHDNIKDVYLGGFYDVKAFQVEEFDTDALECKM